MINEQRSSHIISETNLLRLAKENQSDALSVIHDLYYPQIWRYVCFRLQDSVLCEDIVSEVFFRLIKTLKTKKHTIRELRSWLMGTTHHVVMDHWRKKYRKPVTELSDLIQVSDESHPQQENEIFTQMEDMKNEISALSEDYQNVIAFRFINGYSLEETAKIMKRSVGAVKVLQYRAVNQLRERLQKRGWHGYE